MKAQRARQKIDYDLDDNVPAYKYIGRHGFWAPWEELIQFGEVIQLDEAIEPCEDFEPLNEKARAAMNKFFDKLDAAAEAKAQKDGKSFAKRPRNFNDEYEMPTEINRKIQVTRDGPGIPLMGAKKRGRPPGRKVTRDSDIEIPQTTREEFGNQGSQIPS